MSARTDLVERALAAGVGMYDDDLSEIFTDDATVWSPIMFAAGTEELAEAFADRELAFDNHVVTIRSIDEIGSKVYVEWQLDADHVDGYVLTDDAVIESTGRHVFMGVASVFDFRGDKVSAVRSYFDSLAFLEQIVA
jgi:ketosteroid isomerase-like protein